MNSILKIVFLICLLSSSIHFGQSSKLYLKADYPEFIQQDSMFQVSLVSSIGFNEFDEVELYVVVSNNVELKNVLIRSNYESRKFKFSHVNDYAHLSGAYRIAFKNCNTDSLYKSANQILLTFTASRTENCEIGFGIETYNNGSIVNSESSFDDFDSEKVLPLVELNFYENEKQAGNSLLLKGKGNMEFRFPAVQYNNLMIEFWAKINSGSENFFEVFDPMNNSSIFSLDINKFQMIELPENIFGSDPVNYFVSAHSWNHYLLYFSPDDATATLYVNDSLIYRTTLMNHFNGTNLIINFRNKSNENIELDLLRIWDYKNAISTALKNINYNTYSADSSRLLANFDFNDNSELEKIKATEGVDLKLNNTHLVNSTVPLFSRRPELSIRNFESFYELIWSNKEDKNVEEYLIEKSYNGSKYLTLFTKSSVNEDDKLYTYIDEKSQLEDVVYYRIKQINKDGSVVYSPQVKVGVGKIDMFNVNQNYPNPFNPGTSVSVDIFESGEYKISVYDIVGKEIEKIYYGTLAEGNYVFQFDGSNLPTGIYFFEVSSPNSVQVIKMILAK